MKQKIEGVTYYDADNNRYGFVANWKEGMFKDGVYKDVCFNWVFINADGIEIDVPENFDTVSPQIAALDRHEKELTIQYNQAIQHIKVARNNLLAITNEA